MKKCAEKVLHVKDIIQQSPVEYVLMVLPCYVGKCVKRSRTKLKNNLLQMLSSFLHINFVPLFNFVSCGKQRDYFVNEGIKNFHKHKYLHQS